MIFFTISRKGSDEYEELSACLTTTAGSGRSNFSYDNGGARRIQIEHNSCGNGDLYLQYLPAEFNGAVHLRASSYTALGLKTDGLPKFGEPVEGWVNSKDGGDSLTISTQGWGNLVI